MIVYNAIVCNTCKDIIESENRHDFKTCSCGNVGVDGGLEYLRRIGSPGSYSDLSVDSTEDYNRVRLFVFRTGYGKPGNPDYGVFRKTTFAEMSDEHLQASLDFVKNKGEHWRLLLREKLYRAENEISVPE